MRMRRTMRFGWVGALALLVGLTAGELAARQPLALDGQPEQHEADAEAAAAAAAPPAHAGQEQEAPDAALHHQL